MAEFDSVDWIHKDEDNDDNEPEKEEMVFNPTSVRERIDEKLAILSDFKAKKPANVSRSDVMAGLSK